MSTLITKLLWSPFSRMSAGKTKSMPAKYNTAKTMNPLKKMSGSSSSLHGEYSQDSAEAKVSHGSGSSR